MRFAARLVIREIYPAGGGALPGPACGLRGACACLGLRLASNSPRPKSKKMHIFAICENCVCSPRHAEPKSYI